MAHIRATRGPAEPVDAIAPDTNRARRQAAGPSHCPWNPLIGPLRPSSSLARLFADPMGSLPASLRRCVTIVCPSGHRFARHVLHCGSQTPTRGRHMQYFGITVQKNGMYILLNGMHVQCIGMHVQRYAVDVQRSGKHVQSHGSAILRLARQVPVLGAMMLSFCEPFLLRGSPLGPL
jgi:hypothetical protein